MHRLSRSSRKVRWAPSVPAKTNDSHSPAAADSGVGFSGRANWKINSTSRPSTNSETKPVCERNSIRKSLTRICHTPLRSRGLAVVDARHFLRSGHEASRVPHQPAAAQDRGAIAYFEAATDVVGGEDDRLAAAMKANEDLLQVRDHLRVEPGVRLVEQQQIRIVQERPRQCQPLLHPAREALQWTLAPRLQTNLGQHLLDARLRGADAVEAGVKAQVFGGRQLAIEDTAMAHQSDAPAQRRLRPLLAEEAQLA